MTNDKPWQRDVRNLIIVGSIWALAGAAVMLWVSPSYGSATIVGSLVFFILTFRYYRSAKKRQHGGEHD